MVLRIVFYGGVFEIGGNKILLDFEGERIYLDFGKSFSLWRKYYEFPWNIPKCSEELMAIGELPPKEAISDVKAVLLSHAHLDHSGRAHLLDGADIFCGEGTRIIISAIVETTVRRYGIESFPVDFPSRLKTFRTGTRISFSDIEVTPIHVDHSVPSAYGFIVDTPAGRVVYTGDFRMHGPMKSLTEDFIKGASKDEVDVLIVEGTHIDFSTTMDERDVERKIRGLLEEADRLRTKGLFIADFGRSDYDRLMTFYRVGEELDKILVLDVKRAKLLKMMIKGLNLREKPRFSPSRFAVLKPEKTPRERKLRELYSEFEDMLISLEEVKKEPSRHILMLPFRSAAEIKDLSPPRGSIYILSSSEPVSEESEISFEKLMNWLEHFGIAVYHIHSSGHATPLEIAKLVEELNPRIIVPIHTERPRFLRNYIGGSYKWFIPERKGDALEL